MGFKSVLYLDDIRTPVILGIDIVRSYEEFVTYFKSHEVPDLISLDHDLSPEQAIALPKHGSRVVSYDLYQEKTGYDCAKWLVENNIDIKYWNVHSANPAGAANIRAVLIRYRPKGCLNLKIPYYIASKL